MRWEALWWKFFVRRKVESQAGVLRLTSGTMDYTKLPLERLLYFTAGVVPGKDVRVSVDCSDSRLFGTVSLPRTKFKRLLRFEPPSEIQ